MRKLPLVYGSGVVGRKGVHVGAGCYWERFLASVLGILTFRIYLLKENVL